MRRWSAAQILVNWQSIVARNVNPTDTAVISVGSFHSGEAYNIISDRAELGGTYRVFSDETRELLLLRLEEIAVNVATAYGATADFQHLGYVPATINDEAASALMHNVASAIVGEERIMQIAPMMVGEDMAEFLNRAPGALILVGAAHADGRLHSPHHNPTFDFDEGMLATGVALLAGAAAAYVNR